MNILITGSNGFVGRNLVAVLKRREGLTLMGVLTDSGTPLENITVLHCNTEYPTPFEDVNLKAMQTK